jgi:hypothetical protein
MVGLLFVALLAGQVPAAEPSTAAIRAVVVDDALDVLAEPDSASFATGKLRRGDYLNVVADRGDGWLAIEPPAGSVCWIDQSSLAEETGGEARVIAAQATVRAGNPAARMPGPPSSTVVKGEIVRLGDLVPITLQQGRVSRTWQAIEPPAGESRFVRADRVRLLRAVAPPAQTRQATQVLPASAQGQTKRVSTRLEPVDSALLEVGGAPGEQSLAPALAEALAKVAAAHRQALRGPVDQWNLDPVRQRYQSLLDAETDATARTAIRARLAQVERQQAAAKAARAMQDLLAASRRLDRELAQQRVSGDNARTKEKIPYDAVGLLQRSSKQVDGQKVFALIDRQGNTSAYLSIPPGVQPETLLTRRVGVRGRVRFNELLGTYLVQVTQLEPLTVPP